MYPTLEQTVTGHEHLHGVMSSIDLLLQEQNKRSSPNYSLPLSTAGLTCVIRASHMICISCSQNLRPHHPQEGCLASLSLGQLWYFVCGLGYGQTVVLPSACGTCCEICFVMPRETPKYSTLHEDYTKICVEESCPLFILFPPASMDKHSYYFSYSVSFQSSFTWV